MPATVPTPNTDAEALARRLSDLGASVFMTVRPDGRPFLTFEFTIFPPTPLASDFAALIRHRFATDERFRKDLFGWLYVEGRVHQLFAEHQPKRVLLEERRDRSRSNSRPALGPAGLDSSTAPSSKVGFERGVGAAGTDGPRLEFSSSVETNR